MCVWSFKLRNTWRYFVSAHWNQNLSVEHWKFSWNFKDNETLTRLNLEESGCVQIMSNVSNHYKTLCLHYSTQSLYICSLFFKKLLYFEKIFKNLIQPTLLPILGNFPRQLIFLHENSLRLFEGNIITSLLNLFTTPSLERVKVIIRIYHNWPLTTFLMQYSLTLIY